MDYPIASLAALLDLFASCFRAEVLGTFKAMVSAWALCPGPRTISEVWQATGLAARRHHDTAYALFGSANWSWDELGKILVLVIVARLVPNGVVWLVVDDTLCHKRGATVAFGGFSLDAVLSTRKQKHLRFGLNWIVLGIAVHLPFRTDRYFCLPILWRVYRKKGLPDHQKRTDAAAQMARQVARWLPTRECWLVGDGAYVNSAVLRDRPTNLKVIGPIRWDAALYELPAPRRVGQRGASRKRGERLPTPREMIADTTKYPAEVKTIALASRTRRLRVQVVRDVLWYSGSKTEPVSLVLVRDPKGQWRDEVLLATSTDVSAEFVVSGYCRRWSIEVAFHDSKQFVGLHDPRVRCEKSVERAHPMSWFVLSVSVLWYAAVGKKGKQVRRERPWYRHKKAPTFADMLGALRLNLWDERITKRSGKPTPTPKILKTLVNTLAAVR
jgi:DDE superfamily endonuclease